VYPAETPDGVDFPDATFVEDHIGSMSLSISNPKDGGYPFNTKFQKSLPSKQ